MRMNLKPEIESLTEAVIGAAFEVSNVLGHGFLEAVYRRAFASELTNRGTPFEKEVSFHISYKETEVGISVADFVIDHHVIVELKAVKRLNDTHVGQVLKYLRASDLGVGLLFNFGRPKVEFRRVLAP